MTRRISKTDELVVASHNEGKVREIGELLAGRVARVFSAAELKLPVPDETENTFTGNAALKARTAALASGKIALADDSGLCVDALGGDPGVYSANWAEVGDRRDFGLAMKKVHERLEAIKAGDRKAHFHCALVMAWPDGHCEAVEGTVDGKIVWPPRGSRGFGYDPIFQADGFEQTFGEIDPDRKNSISHRANAFRKLLEKCFH